MPAAVFVRFGDIGGWWQADWEGRVAVCLEEVKGLELRLDGVRVGGVAALVVAVFGAILPHPAHVLDWIVVVGDAVVVDLGDAGEECGPGEGDVAAGGEVDAGFVGDCGRGAAVVCCGEGCLIERLHDVAEWLDRVLKAVVLVEGQGRQEIRCYVRGLQRCYLGHVHRGRRQTFGS